MMIGSSNGDDFESPPVEDLPMEEAALPVFGASDDADQVEAEARAADVRREHEPALLTIDGVEGVATETRGVGDLHIIVFVRDHSVADQVPAELDGIPVEVEVAEFDAFASGGSDPGAQPAPRPSKRSETEKKATKKAKATAKKKGTKKSAAKRKKA